MIDVECGPALPGDSRLIPREASDTALTTVKYPEVRCCAAIRPPLHAKTMASKPASVSHAQLHLGNRNDPDGNGDGIVVRSRFRL